MTALLHSLGWEVSRRANKVQGLVTHDRIFSKRTLRAFWKEHPRAQASLEDWYKVARKAEWEKFADVRETFGSADQVGKFTVFNIGGNKYRLIAVIHFNRGTCPSAMC